MVPVKRQIKLHLFEMMSQITEVGKKCITDSMINKQKSAHKKPRTAMTSWPFQIDIKSQSFEMNRKQKGSQIDSVIQNTDGYPKKRIFNFGIRNKFTLDRSYLKFYVNDELKIKLIAS